MPTFTMCSRWANVSLSAIVPQCRFGNTSCESSGTVAGPSARPASRSSSMRSAWCSWIALRATGNVGERMTVRRQSELHAVEVGDEIERREVRLERVGVAHTRHVRRDRRQHVVAGEQHARLGIPRADVVDGVARRVHREPIATAHPDARSPWCTRWVGSGGVNNMRMARIISLRRQRRALVLACPTA